MPLVAVSAISYQPSDVKKMKSETLTINQLLQDRRQYRVPFYQRHYVWNQEEQWEPLWKDVVEKAEHRLDSGIPASHFLGAIVLEPQPREGLRGVESFHVIDGQQRLTTLQYLLASLLMVIRERAIPGLLPLVEGCVQNTNPDTMSDPEVEKFKVWPTFRDRVPYQAAMTALSLDELKKRFSSHFTQSGTFRKIGIDHPPALAAIWFFREAIDTWVGTTADVPVRLERLAEAVLGDLKLVLITLEPQDDPQVIFETLNGRGAELHATDLVRNYIFMRADRETANPATLYDTLWRDFESPFWSEGQRRGRLTRPRLEWFMQTVLQSEIADEIDVGKIYDGYRRWAGGTSPPLSATAQLQNLSRYADKYRIFIDGNGSDPLAWFGRNIMVWDVSPAHTVALKVAVSDATPDAQRQIYEMIISYVVRRAICGLTNKNYNKVFLQILKRLGKGTPTADAVRETLIGLSGEATRWPNDDDFLKQWMTGPLISRLGDIKRVRAVLTALENGLRSNRSEERSVEIDNVDVDHILPTSWYEHWSVEGSNVTKEQADAASLYDIFGDGQSPLEAAMGRREQLKHTIGNLTLAHYGINRSVQNAAFDRKRELFFAESNLHLNRPLMRLDAWDEASIENRGKLLFDKALAIWRGPGS